MNDILEILRLSPQKHEIEEIFALMKKLREINPGDTWEDNYRWHLNKRGDSFFDTYHCMKRIGKEMNPKTILEIGCRTGISICQLLSNCPNQEGKKIYLFDVFNDGFISPELIKINLEYIDIQTSNIEFFTGKSEETIPKFKYDNPSLKFDYILVDGSHDRRDAKVDLDNVSNIVNPGGVIIFDDIAPDGCDLIDVWNKWKGEQGNNFDYFEDMNGKGVGVARYKGGA